MAITRLSRLSIRTRLTLLVLSLALPFAGYSILSSIEEARLEREQAAARLFGIAQVTAARLDDQVNDIRTVLQLLSAVVVPDQRNRETNDALLQSLTGKIPTSIDNLSVWTTDGREVGTLDSRLRGRNANAVVTRRFFQEALAGGAMSAQAPLESLATGQRISAFGLPISKAGRVVGVVAASVRLDALQTLVRGKSDLPTSAIVTVLDRNGVVLARSLDSEQWVGRTIRGVAPGTTDRPSTFGPDGPRDGRSADGIERLAGIATSGAIDWRVYVGLPREEALAPVYGRLRNGLLTAAAILFVGLILAGFVGESIAMPLRTLATDAGHFGTGNLAYRSDLRDDCEVGALAATLNQMAEQLEGRTSDLLLAQAQLRQITDSLPALISYVDADERFRFANQVYEVWLDRKPQDVQGQRLADVYGSTSYERYKHHIHEAFTGKRVEYERAMDTAQGLRHVKITAIPDVREDGRVAGLFMMMIDVTATHEAEKALADSERRLRMVADNIPALVAYIDREQRYRFVNKYLGGVFAIDPALLLGRTVRESGGERLYAEISPHIAAALRGDEVTYEGMWCIESRIRHYQCTYVPDIDDHGAVQGYYAMTFDISALKETQHRLDTIARVDALTGLPNRRQFEERLADAMARAQRSDTFMAVLFLDIDHFKSINDSLGHGAGDAVLREFGRRLQHQLRGTDVVARLGGDEFVVLVEGLRQRHELDSLATKILRSVRRPVLVDDLPLPITTSIGVATYDGGDTSTTDLLNAADQALYAAKRAGRNRHALASADVEPAIVA